MSIFAKFEGVDGESKDAEHEKWIDVLSSDWGMNKPGSTVLVPGSLILHRNPNA